ncbi:MAG TPA: hypothetical protein VFK05_11430, partial [Polyangiaceae bacterium]|nr:hypothetical protein [Polyangiaceae bacterium]
MQQTKSYWRFLAAAGVVSAFVVSACVVTTEEDDSSSAGSGGSGTAGSHAAGSPAAGSPAAGSGTGGSTGGTTGTAGSPAGGSGAVPFQCDPGEGGAQGTPNSCKPDPPPGDDCEKCIQDKCCAEYEACYAYNPGNQCGWGGPAKLPSGKDYDGGEALCIQLCVQEGTEMSGTDPDAELLGTCANGCTTQTSTGG